MKLKRLTEDRAVGWSVGLVTLLLASGCGKGASSEEEACQEVQQHLEQSAWPTVLGTNCADCHTPGGPAPAEGSDFVLLPPGYPNFQQRNLESISEIAAYEVDDVSILLLKPLGNFGHGGGARIKKGTDEYKSLEKLVELVSSSNSCASAPQEIDLDDVSLLNAKASFRKAALHLAYRLPSSDENARLEKDGEAALPGMVEGLTTEAAFYERLKDIFNDKFLTRRYLAYSGYAANVLNDTMYPQSGDIFDEITDEDQKRAINKALAEEPLEFVAHLVRNDKPFTDIVEGGYMVVNPFSAPYLNANVEFQNPDDPNEWLESERFGVVEVARDVYEMQTDPQRGRSHFTVFPQSFPHHGHESQSTPCADHSRLLPRHRHS